MSQFIGYSVLGVLGGYIALRTQSDNFLLDYQVLKKLLPAGLEAKSKTKLTTWGFVDAWDLFCKSAPDKMCLKFIEDDDTFSSLTFKQVDEISNQVANFLRSIGLKYGEVVALLMENKFEFITTWLGIAKAGGVASLINTNLRDRPLVHSLKTCRASKYVIGSEHSEVIKELRKNIDYFKDGLFFLEGKEAEGFESFNKLVKEQPKDLIGGFPPQRNPNDPIMYIYTSGTTGLPKASIISNSRMYTACCVYSAAFAVNSNDVYYCSLPFYHSAGTLIATVVSWRRGIPLVFRRKFSARKFWTDCAKHNCTITQYIGELCHYLLERPEAPEDKAHKVRLMIGNGMRANIWDKFKKRFNVSQIGEFYAATEGTTALFNVTDKTGSVGYAPKLLMKISAPLTLIKYDVERDEIEKGPDGFCQTCKPGEVGQLIGLLDPASGVNFKGYTSKEATEKKIMRNVFKKGDMWYLSGDLLKQDNEGFFYFVDRIGDTYRWKGENVATNEVEIVLEEFPGVHEVNVYGVAMPNTAGRAGMAYLVTDKTFDLKKFYDYTNDKLPSYAIPLFLRFGKEIEVTGTLKHTKTSARQEGFNINVVQDPVYIRDKESATYIPLTKEIYQHIMSGQAKL